MSMTTQELRKLVEDKPLFATTLMSKVHDYFQDADHRRKFEAWYEKKYGEKYVWGRD